MVEGQKAENIDQKGAEEGIVNGKEKGEWEPQHFSYWLLLPSYMSMKVYIKILYGSSSFFKFLSENYVQGYKTHKLCWITACNNLGYSHDKSL
jgi:hypothetical protein